MTPTQCFNILHLNSQSLNIFLKTLYKMSSSLRTHPVPTETTKYKKVMTPAYYDENLGTEVPIPFIYSNNTIDIDIRNNVQNDLISSGNGPNSDPDFQCTTMGGSGLVLNLGPKMKEWLNTWLSNLYSSGSVYETNSCKVHHSGVMTKAQFVNLPNVEHGRFLGCDVDNSTYAISDAMPASEFSSNLVFGIDNNKYNAVWIFRTPLIISFKVSGATKYLTLFSNFASHD
jgi:hypothetical protein